jgi:A/G-specific adenine glycosylase
MPLGKRKVEKFRRDLLSWYDINRRVLPWRALPGKKPNPYHVWLSEVMLQQTTVPAVIPYFLKFTKKWPKVADLASAPANEIMENWAGLGYYARARNLHKCAITVANDHKGKFPQTQDGLIELAGIGDYTSNAIAAIAFNRPANVVDGNVERVMARIFAVTQPVPDSKTLLKSLAGVMAEGEQARPGDYAQALMDLGATVCTPTSPKCLICPVSKQCEGRNQGIQAALPTRKSKAVKPQRHGHIYWVRDAKGRVLFERRPEKGLLAATIGLPTSEWVEKGSKSPHLAFLANPKMLKAVEVRHSFTHFDLTLSGAEVSWSNHLPATMDRYFWVERDEIENLGIPTVFKKAVKLFNSLFVQMDKK